MNQSAKIIAHQIDEYLKQLFPINRSITGPGNRETLQILQELVPIKILEYRSGSKVYDWQIPDEWEIKEAWIRDNSGNTLVDFEENNIHLVGYSESVNRRMSFNELKSHLHVHDKLPNAIPYRTTYYEKNWGFCVTKEQFKYLEKYNDYFHVYIKSHFKPNGSLSIGELLIPGQRDEEILISTYMCHPSLANDNLSGTVLTTFLARELLALKNLKYSYRIIWVPETIGAITYCAFNQEKVEKIKMGLVVTTVGGSGTMSYKQSWDNKHFINDCVEQTFRELEEDFVVYPFDIHGSDERQYSSQGFRINTVTIAKDKYYEYPEYHTSLDNLELVSGKNIKRTLDIYLALIKKLEKRVIYKSTKPHCEPMLSKHNLYPKNGGALLPKTESNNELDILLWVLFLSDGNMSSNEIAKKLNVSNELIMDFYRRLEPLGIVKKI